MTARVLITGGLGYLGGRIASHFQSLGEYELRLGTRKADDKQPEWLHDGSMVTMDMMSGDSLDAACDGVKTIVHLAALNSTNCADNPEQALTINGLGTLKLLHAAARSGVERFIYFSTAHVYGAPLVGVISEENTPRPVHSYSITHRVAEDYVLAAHDSGSLIGLVVRLSNGFGCPMDVGVSCWGLIVNDLCRQAVIDKRLVLRSSGLQYRDFIALSDVAAATAHLSRFQIEQSGNGLFNLGGELSLRVIDLAETIAERCEIVLGYKPELQHVKAENDEELDFLDYRMDKLLKTGFKIQGSMHEEIDATLKLCRSSFL